MLTPWNTPCVAISMILALFVSLASENFISGVSILPAKASTRRGINAQQQQNHNAGSVIFGGSKGPRNDWCD